MASECTSNKGKSDFVFLLFGPTRSGKSATGNVILGRQIFTEYETQRCAAAEGTIVDRYEQQKIRIVDTKATPDYSGVTDTVLQENSEITRSLLLSPNGPRNIVMVVKKDQKAKQVAGCVQFLEIMLGMDALRDLILIFTGTTEVSDAAFNIFVNTMSAYSNVQQVLRKCKNNRIAFNDGDTPGTNQVKVINLLKMAKNTNQELNEIQLVMIGQSWAGKSKAANNILGEEVFVAGTETQGFTAARRNVNGKDVMVVDTPGFFSKIKSNDKIISELTEPVNKLSAPSRIFALVIRMDRHELSEEEKEIITICQDQFRRKIATKLIIVFTRLEEYLSRGKSFEEFLRSPPPELKILLKQCHYRCVGFNNMAMIDGKPEVNVKQVSVLLQLVDKADTEDTKLRLVLLGRTGMGKSSAGNTILGEADVFKHTSGMTSLTTRCKQVVREIDGRLVEIVDTPGLFDTRPENTATVTLMEMARCLTMTVPGPHAFLLVIASTEKFTKEQQQCIDIIRRTFKEEIFRHTVVIFTKVDHLDQPIEEAIRTSGEGLKDVLTQNNNRWLAFNNRSPSGDESERLIETVELMLACNEGRHYTSTMYKQVATRLQAYGAGNVAEMRAIVEEHPWAILGIVLLLTGVGGFGFGILCGIITVAVVFFTLLYESIVGGNIPNR